MNDQPPADSHGHDAHGHDAHGRHDHGYDREPDREPDRDSHADLGMIETIRLRTPDHVVLAVPYLLGFVPADSIVALLLAGGHVQATVRLDLPAPADTVAVATVLTGTFARAEVTPEQLVLVGYGPADITPTLSRFADALPWPVTGLLRVDAGRWWSLTCPDPACCPPGARIEPDEAITAPLLATSGQPATSRQARAADLASGPRSVRNDVADALVVTRWLRLPPQELLERFTAAHAARAERRVPLSTDEAAMLLHGLRQPLVRDACVVWADVAAMNLWCDLLAVAPDAFVAPPATLLALAAYRLGDGALASMAALRALEAEPGYRLAVMALQAVRLPIPPSEVTTLLQEAIRDLPVSTQMPPGHPTPPADPAH